MLPYVRGDCVGEGAVDQHVVRYKRGGKSAADQRRGVYVLTQPSLFYVATDVGLWMSLPAFGPALIVVGVVLFVIRRDRRKTSQGAATAVEHTSPSEGRDDNQ